MSNSQVNATYLAPNDWQVQLMGTKPELNLQVNAAVWFANVTELYN